MKKNCLWFFGFLFFWATFCSSAGAFSFQEEMVCLNMGDDQQAYEECLRNQRVQVLVEECEDFHSRECNEISLKSTSSTSSISAEMENYFVGDRVYFDLSDVPEDIKQERRTFVAMCDPEGIDGNCFYFFYDYEADKGYVDIERSLWGDRARGRVYSAGSAKEAIVVKPVDPEESSSEEDSVVYSNNVFFATIKPTEFFESAMMLYIQSGETSKSFQLGENAGLMEPTVQTVKCLVSEEWQTMQFSDDFSNLTCQVINVGNDVAVVVYPEQAEAEARADQAEEAAELEATNSSGQNGVEERSGVEPSPFMDDNLIGNATDTSGVVGDIIGGGLSALLDDDDGTPPPKDDDGEFGGGDGSGGSDGGNDDDDDDYVKPAKPKDDPDEFDRDFGSRVRSFFNFFR